MTSALKTVAKFASPRSRRADVLADVNADFHGRRPSGDARLELAYFDRGFDRHW